MKLLAYTAIAAALVALVHGDAYAQLQSQVVAGSDNGTTRRILKTDNTGRLEVIGAAAGGVAYGPDAVNTPPTQAPITVGCVYDASPPSVTDGDVVHVLCDTNGRLQTSVTGGVTVSGTVAVTQSTSPWVVGQSTASDLNAQVVGNVADNTAASGNPVGVGGIYNSSLPTYLSGNRTQFQTGSRGSLRTQICSDTDSGTCARVVTSVGDNSPTARTSLYTVSYNYGYDGSTMDLVRTVEGASSATGVLATSIIPNSSINVGITPSVSTAPESSRVLKASAGNFYGVAVTTGAVAGYIMLFNATSAPADGAVTPLLCRAAAAYSSVEIDRGNIPDVYSTGITAVFSSTGCFTKTASATAMFEGRTK